MKKHSELVFGVCLAIGLAIAFTGCGSAPKATVFDKSVPLEQSSTVNIPAYTYVGTRINGKSVEWVTSMFNQKQVIIPAGEYIFKIGTDNNRRWGYVDVMHNFLPGHTYHVMAWIDGSSIYGRIIDDLVISRELIPDPSSPNATALEGVWVSTNNEDDLLTISGNDYIALSKKNNFVSHRGTFTQSGNNLNLTAWAILAKTGSWLVIHAESQYVYNGTTIKGKGFFSTKDIEYKKAE